VTSQVLFLSRLQVIYAVFRFALFPHFLGGNLVGTEVRVRFSHPLSSHCFFGCYFPPSLRAVASSRLQLAGVFPSCCVLCNSANSHFSCVIHIFRRIFPLFGTSPCRRPFPLPLFFLTAHGVHSPPCGFSFSLLCW